MPGDGEEFLRRLGANDELAARAVLALRPEPGDAFAEFHHALSAKVRMLVCLAALVALDASTTSIRWAAELACFHGADIDDITRVLVTVGADVGIAPIVSGAPRVALAVGFEPELDGWDGA